MAGKRTFKGEIREALGDVAKEMGFAVDSIRNEVIEKGWFDQRDLTPEVADQWARDDIEPDGIEGAQDFRREDVYGHDQELGQDIDQDRSMERDQEIER